MFENRWRKKPTKANEELKKVKQLINEINNERTSRSG